jgi:release factor H-coupled RctB family protein
MEKLTLIASRRNWIDTRSVETLQQLTSYKGITSVVGLPDLSVGRVPNGMALFSTNRIYPHLIGSDIGCGMALFETKIKAKKIKAERFYKYLSKIESLDEIDIESEIEGYNLGTIGRGNHFAELHRINQVHDSKLFDELGLNEESLYTLVHSGSRAYGQIVFDRVSGRYDPTKGMEANSNEAQEYLANHHQAIAYAKQSREVITNKLLKAIKVSNEAKLVSDTAHNSIIQYREGWLHRKGATPTDQGAVIIAGSRGSLSYLVMPTSDTTLSNYSLAHGAGRKWERGSVEAKLKNRYTKSDLLTTAIGSRVICEDKKLLYEEASEAYKNIDIVINDLVEAGLATIIASFKPIITYKE